MKFTELKTKFQHKYTIRIMAGVLTVALLGGSCGIYSVRAEKSSGEEAARESVEEEEKIEDAIKNIVSGSTEERVVGKEETVYLIANEKGEVKETIVSDWLKNPNKSEILQDASDLENIENVKGDEKYEKSGSMITWNAAGNDIYYQGTTTKTAPISEKITYFLDDKEIEPKELAGKSGRVKIRFDYTNHEKTTKTVDGTDYEVCVPFTVVTGMILGDQFTNLEIENGKIISDGKNNIVVGMAMPGLKESLMVEEEDFDEEAEFPDYVEVTADVQDFSLDMTMTLATNELLGSVNANGELDLSALDELVDEMTDASGLLADGSGELAEGLDTLKESMGVFSSGVSDLKKGIADYTNGAKTLQDGIGTLKTGADAVAEGAGTLDASANTISDGITSLDKTLKKKFTDKEKNDLLAQAGKAIDAQKNTIQKSAQSAVEAQETTIKSKAEASVGAQAEAIQAQAQTAVDAQAATIKKQAQAAVEAQAASIKKQAEQSVELQFGSADDENSYYNAIKKQAQTQVGEKFSGMSQSISDGVTVYTRQVAEGIYTQMVTSQVISQLEQGLMASGLDEASALAQAQQMVQAEPYQSQIQGAVLEYVNQTMASDAVEGGIQTMTQNLLGGMSQASGEIGTAVADAAFSGAKTAAGEAAVTGAKAAAGEAAVTGAKAAAGEAAVTGAKAAAGEAAFLGAKEAAAEAAFSGAKAAAGEAAVSAAEQTKKTVAKGIEEKDKESGYSLVTGARALAEGTGDFVKAMPSLNGGIKQLLTGAQTLVSNNDTLNKGAGTLADGTTQLVDGVDQLEGGSNDLEEGMKDFDEKAIQRLADTYQGDVKSLLDRIKAFTMAGEEYTTFSEVADGVNGSVKFIWKTDGIKTE